MSLKGGEVFQWGGCDGQKAQWGVERSYNYPLPLQEVLEKVGV